MASVVAPSVGETEVAQFLESTVESPHERVLLTLQNNNAYRRMRFQL
jgi:hypothetical protein